MWQCSAVPHAETHDQIALLTRSEALQLRRIAEQLSDRGTASPTIAETNFGTMIALGPGLFVNRVLTTRSHLADDDVNRLIEFFVGCGVPPSVQIADPDSATVALLESAGFELDWRRALCELAPPVDRYDGPSPFEFVIVDESRLDEWLGILARGNEVPDGAPRAVSDDFARAAHAANESVEFLALLDGSPVGCGSLLTVDDVGWLGGAATLPNRRRNGAQSALLRHRLGQAHMRGFGRVAATATAESVSARNLVRAGFEVIAIQHVFTLN